MSRGLPIGRLTACGLLAVATFLPWARVGVWASWKPSPFISLSTAASGITSQPEPVAVGWSSVTTVDGLDFPNWLVMAAATFVAGYALIERTPDTKVPHWLPALFGLYGLLHLLTFGALILFNVPSGFQDLRFGWWLALLSVLSILVSTLRLRRASVPVKAASTAAEEV